MKTTIDNNQKVFLIAGDMNKTIFCNISGIPDAVNSFDDKDSIYIYYFWNAARKRASKKLLNQMFKDHNINFRVK